MAQGNGNGPFPPDSGIFAYPIHQQSPLNHVEPHEKQAAEFIVYEQFKALCGKYPPRVEGYFVAIRIHQRDISKKIVRDDGTEVEMYTGTERTQTEDKYQSMVGLVVAMGRQAYKGTDQFGNPRFSEGPWCAVGDFAIFPRYEGAQITYRNIPLILVPDDKILGVVEDPDDIIATHLKDR